MNLDLSPLTAAQLEALAPTWLEKLGAINRDRLVRLLPLFKDGEAPLAGALAIIAPAKDRPSALAAYQTFAKRVNDAAKKAGLDLALRVDSKKQTDPEDRTTWIEGPSPDLERLAEFTREAVSTLDRQEARIPSSAAVLTAEEHQHPERTRPLIRFFLSYAHHDDTLVDKLRKPLEKELKLSKRYRFEVWTDHKIMVGTGWRDAISSALSDCHFGLLMVSRDFLLSEFILREELPVFVNGAKPCIPVGLKPLDFARIDMKGLAEKQIFRLTRTGMESKAFSTCREPMSDEFVRQLATRIEERVADHLRAPLPSASAGEYDPIHEFSHRIVANTPLPKFQVKPEGGSTDFLQWEKDAAALAQNRTSAVDYLVNWFLSPEAACFCAVLGETGIGKTTTLMMLAHEMDRRRAEDPTIPAVIFIDLKDYYYDGEPTLETILAEVIRRHWKGESGRSITPEMVIRAVRERGALVIFDGLDERIIPLPQQRRDSFIRQLWSILPPLAQSPKGSTRHGRLIISCRSHYFQSVSALGSAFTGEGREGIRQRDYAACVILPFCNEQIRSYLGQMLGPERVEDAIGIIRSVHNLTDLSTRPFLLSLIAPELEALEQMKKDGRTVLGVTLYGLFVDKWLRRDEYKHQFTPDHKLIMMEALAAHLAAINQKTLPWAKVAKWLDRFLAAHPEIRDRYGDKPAEVLNQDFRAATFCLRPDTEKDGFRFAHTSLFEYFLALHLVHALEENRPTAWDMPLPSDETLDFAGQLLAEGEKVDAVAAITIWAEILEDSAAAPNARRNAFRAWLIAREKQWPTPAPKRPQLHGLDLEAWHIGAATGPPLDLRGASLAGSCLDHAVLQRVLLTGTDATGASARLMELQEVNLDDSIWAQANLTGGTWRDCTTQGLKSEGANWYDCDLIRCGAIGCILQKQQHAPAIEHPSLILRQGHCSGVNDVSWSPDGAQLATASDDDSIKIWDIFTGRCLITISNDAHSSVTAVDWSPDGAKIITGTAKGNISLWNATTGQFIREIESHGGQIPAAGFSKTGELTYSAGNDSEVRVWKLQSQECIRRFDITAVADWNVPWASAYKWAPCVALSNDGKRILIGGNTGFVTCWSIESGERLLRLAGHTHWITCLSWRPDGQRIASGSDDKSIRIWNSVTGDSELELMGHSEKIKTLAWSPGGDKLASAGVDKDIRIWDVETGICKTVLSGHTKEINSVKWSPDGNLLASGSEDNVVRIWEVSTGRCLMVLEKHRNWVSCVGWSPDGSHLLSGTFPRVLIWNSSNGSMELPLVGHELAVLSAAWSPDGSKVLTGSFDKTVRLWDASTGKCLDTYHGHDDGITSVAWAPDGIRVVSASEDHRVKIWDTDAGICLHTLDEHTDCVFSAAWSPNGSQIATGGLDRLLKIWDASSGCCLLTLEHPRFIRSVAWSPDNSLVLVAGTATEVKIVDARNGALRKSLKGHSAGVWSALWSPDGTRVLSGGSDRTVKVWDVNSGRCVLSLPTTQSIVMGVAWSPDGTLILASGSDSTLREWDAVTGKPLRTWLSIGEESALLDFPHNRILHATPGAWRYLGWQGWDPKEKRRRLLPAEAFGPLPPW